MSQTILTLLGESARNPHRIVRTVHRIGPQITSCVDHALLPTAYAAIPQCSVQDGQERSESLMSRAHSANIQVPAPKWRPGVNR